MAETDRKVLMETAIVDGIEYRATHGLGQLSQRFSGLEQVRSILPTEIFLGAAERLAAEMGSAPAESQKPSAK